MRPGALISKFHPYINSIDLLTGPGTDLLFRNKSQAMKKILIVDDNKEVRQLVKTTLGTDVYKLFEASNGQKAVESASRQHPDLIIMDVIMPGGIDGIEATRQIKNAPETADCLVIILTGSESDRSKEGFEAGACDFIIKPFSPLDLINKVEELLGSAS
jgi:two-component system, OmpR family, phosphate regulon response regulator PhoB